MPPIAPRSTEPRRGALGLLSDAEVIDLARAVAGCVDAAAVDVAGVRALLADWELVAAIRSRPDHEAKRQAFLRAVADTAPES